MYAEVNKNKAKNEEVNGADGPVVYAEVNKPKKGKMQEDGPMLYAEVDKTKKKGGKQADNEGPVLYAEINKKDKGKKKKNSKDEEGPVLYAEVGKKKNKKDKKDKKKGKKSKQELQPDGKLCLLKRVSFFNENVFDQRHDTEYRVSLLDPILVTAPISVVTSGNIALPLCHMICDFILVKVQSKNHDLIPVKHQFCRKILTILLLLCFYYSPCLTRQTY